MRLKALLALLFIASSVSADTFVDTVKAGSDNVLFWRNTVTAGDRGFDNPGLELDFGRIEFPASSGTFYTNDVGVRFTNVACTSGVTVDSAALDWYTPNGAGTGLPTISIYGVKAANPGTFTDSTAFKALTLTTAVWNYSMTAGQTTSGVVYRMGPNSSLTSVIQEILDVGGHQATHAMAFVIKDNSSPSGAVRIGDVYGSGITKAMRLTIWFHATSGGTAAGAGAQRVTQRTTQR